MDAPKKIFLSFFAIILSLLVIFVTAISSTTPKDIRSRASVVSTNAVSLTLTPNEGTYRVGDLFNVQIYLNTFGVETNGVGARLRYDPRFLEAVQITPGSVFPSYPAATFNLADGTIYLSGISFDATAGKPASTFVGTGLLGTVRFRSKTVTSTTAVLFDFAPGGRTDDSNVMDAKTMTDVLEKVYNSTFTIEP